MNIIVRLRVWFRRWRRKRATKKQNTPLREFVYLDEVSVYSLNASKLGSIAAEFTETQTVSLQDEIGSSLEVGGSGIAKVGATSRSSTSQTRGSQVLRRSIVQTTFKKLYELELDSLAMRPISEDVKPPKMDSLKDLEAQMEELESDGWIVDPAKLARGRLLEVEVQLEAEAIFRVNAVVSALVEIVQDDPEMFGPLDERLGQVRSVNRILEKLLVDLVPIRGRATDYEVVELEGREQIVHRMLLDQLSSTDPLPTRPLHVVGVAEQSLFWKDIRRVLFSGARFRVLCRVAQDGLQDSWTPVKLSHVLGSLAPGLVDRIDALGSGAFAPIAETSKPEGSAERRQQLMREALGAYAKLMAAHYGHSLTTQDLSEVGLLSEHHCASFGTLTERREAFGAITAFLDDRFDLPREPVIAAQYRSDVLEEVGLLWSEQVISPVLSNGDSSPTPSQGCFLDSEFVAIYW